MRASTGCQTSWPRSPKYKMLERHVQVLRESRSQHLVMYDLINEVHRWGIIATSGQGRLSLRP